MYLLPSFANTPGSYWDSFSVSTSVCLHLLDKDDLDDHETKLVRYQSHVSEDYPSAAWSSKHWTHHHPCSWSWLYTASEDMMFRWRSRPRHDRLNNRIVALGSHSSCENFPSQCTRYRKNCFGCFLGNPFLEGPWVRHYMQGQHIDSNFDSSEQGMAHFASIKMHFQGSFQ